MSLQDGTIDTGFTFQWNWSTYSEAITDYSEQFLRSIQYAATATIAAFVIGFPLAYFTAFKAGKWRNVFLLLIVLPFFVSYLVRTIAWRTILADDGMVVDLLKSLGILEPDGRLLETSFSVIAGITYNFLPFMVLPIYVSLEKIDKRLIEAASDLYAGPWVAFRKVTLRLAAPGIFAGCLLTFIPAIGDYINAQLLGTSRQTMIGNVIQSKFLVLTDYPTAAALSFTLLVGILILLFIAVRALGTRTLTESVA